MEDLFRRRDKIAGRHRRLFDLLRTGEISANTLETERPINVQPRSRDLRGDGGIELTDIQRRAVESLLFGDR
jgi:hypothetical protein